MSLEIKKKWDTDGGDYDCIEYTITVPFKDTLVYEYPYGHRVTPKEEQKYKNILIKNTPKTEKILKYGFSSYANSSLKIVTFHLNTKPIKDIQKEQEIIDKLKDTKYKQKWGHEYNSINENGYIRLTNIPLDEQNINKVMKILNGKTWYLGHIPYDEYYLRIKIKE